MDFERYAKNNTRHLEAMMQGLARYIHCQATMGIEPLSAISLYEKMYEKFQKLEKEILDKKPIS